MTLYVISSGSFSDREVEARNANAARYADFKALREAGYFQERDGFHRYLTAESPRAMLKARDQ